MASWKRYYIDGSGYEEVYSYDTGFVSYQGDGIKMYQMTNCFRKKIFTIDGRLVVDSDLGGSSENFLVGSYFGNVNFALYGKWLYNDGSDVETDDEFETISDYDFSEAPERDLEDLLKKILDEFELKQPDLSSIEGLLNAIYARLGTLDSDDDNALLSQILAAIEAIKLENTDNSELLDILENLKNSLVYDDGENVETISKQLKKIIDNQLTVDDFTIDEELYNNRMEILQLRLMGKFSFIHDLSDFVTYIFNSYSNSSDSPEINFTYGGNSYSVNLDYYKDFLPLVQCIIAAFIYITYAYHTYRKVPSYINGGDNE